MKEIMAKLALVEAKAKAKGRTKAIKATKAPPAQLTLPLWPEAVRAVPNVVLRGALFSINQRRPIANERELIATAQGVEIRFTGRRWNQVDLDLLEMLLHLSRLQPLGDRVEFSSTAILKELGRGTAGKEHEELKNGIARLAGSAVEIKWLAGMYEGKAVGGTLISTYFRDDETGRNVVILNKKIIELYENGYSHIDWEQRKALGSNSLAKWLHGFYATHAAPFPYKVETIRNLSGSAVGRLVDFRRMLRQALTQLVEVGALIDWELDKNDLVHVARVPSESQARHVLKKVKVRVLTHKRSVDKS